MVACEFVRCPFSNASVVRCPCETCENSRDSNGSVPWPTTIHDGRCNFPICEPTGLAGGNLALFPDGLKHKGTASISFFFYSEVSFLGEEKFHCFSCKQSSPHFATFISKRFQGSTCSNIILDTLIIIIIIIIIGFIDVVVNDRYEIVYFR